MGEWLYQKIRELFQCLLEILFPEPANCSCCGRKNEIDMKYRLCGRCISKLKAYDGGLAIADTDGSYDDGIAAYCYEGIARDMIHWLKYKDRRNIAPAVALLLADCICDKAGNYDVIVPVPVSKKKQSSRGYNHVQLIAVELSRAVGIEVLECLERIRDTKPQVLFNISERWYNVKGCFACGCRLDNKRVLLIDDILTTGATAHYCAEAMKACGAQSVTVLAFAKSIMK